MRRERPKAFPSFPYKCVNDRQKLGQFCPYLKLILHSGHSLPNLLCNHVMKAQFTVFDVEVEEDEKTGTFCFKAVPMYIIILWITLFIFVQPGTTTDLTVAAFLGHLAACYAG